MGLDDTSEDEEPRLQGRTPGPFSKLLRYLKSRLI
jgi:hypothetical protein